MVFFLHIPKTAGTTFYDVVKANHISFLKPKADENPKEYLKNTITKDTAIRLPGGYKTAPQVLNCINQLSRKKKQSISFIGGHVGYGFHNTISQRVQYISFIRDPRERIISDYKEHCKKGRYFYDILHKDDFKFNTYLKAVKANNLDNIFTRQLAGPFDFFLNERKPFDNDLFERAKLNCKSVFFFELNSFDEALLYLKNELGWKK